MSSGSGTAASWGRRAWSLVLGLLGIVVVLNVVWWLVQPLLVPLAVGAVIWLGAAWWRHRQMW